MRPRPIVDLSPKPSRCSRLASWFHGPPIEPPEHYEARPCDPCIAVGIIIAAVAVLIALAIAIAAVVG